ncbi:MAG: GAF domain-containing sensor histidine kinase [Oscillochloris sp.]|nr:GAF domain-containing sensor histidine kinase [Oscillochloris sp.]
MTQPERELERRNRELAILNTIAAALNQEVDLSRALSTTLAHVVALCGLRTGWIWLLDDQGAALPAATLQLPPALADEPERMCGSCYCLDSFCAGEMDGPANISVITCTRLKGLSEGTAGLRHHASVPLIAHGRRLGVLNVAAPDWAEVAQDDLRMLATIGDLLSSAVERARLFARSAEIGALEERNRLARELHDTLAQDLTAITLKLETADALLEDAGDGQAARTVLKQAMDVTRRSLADVRRSVLDLRAAPLDGRPLDVALCELAGAAETVTAAVQISGDVRHIPARAVLGLYRIVQEALQNVLRHAAATHVRIRLDVQEHQVHLEIADDGRGFDPAATPGGRFGLIGMRERARLLGGRLTIDSAPGRGSTVQVEVPL